MMNFLSFMEKEKLMDYGVHIGHKKSFLHPTMLNYICDKTKKISFINLFFTIKILKELFCFIDNLILSKKEFHILFLLSKRSTRSAISFDGEHKNISLLNKWINGFVSNFNVIVSNSLIPYLELKKQYNINVILEEQERKKIENSIEKKTGKLAKFRFRRWNRKFNHMTNINQIDLLIASDCKYSAYAIKECILHNVPVAAIVDTDMSCKDIKFPIYGNDDLISSVSILLNSILDYIKNKCN